MNVSRRTLLGWGGIAAFGTAVALRGLTHRRQEALRFGPLVDDPNGIFDLPAGYQYKVLLQSDARMSDGNRRRGAPDGMASALDAHGNIVLLLNHELSEDGGVSRLVLEPKTLKVLSSNDVLRGTVRNCSGGPSPWGWLSCEEYEDGLVWLCPWDAESTLSGDARRAIASYGRFRHEAVCIDPQSHVAYLTEDDGPSHLYRMVPDTAGEPFSGRLQALVAQDRKDHDTEDMAVGDSFPVTWCDVEPQRARASAAAQGAAIFHRGEGIWFDQGDVYFSATANDQLFVLEPTKQGGRVRLLTRDLQSPDNLTVTPWGEVMVAEDQLGSCRLRLVGRDGKTSTFARNALGPAQEIAGVCFSPDGQVLFCNLQKSGHTLAITGPFAQSVV